MNIAQAKADLKKRQEALAKEFNQILAQEQALAQRKAQLIQEITMNNGEVRGYKRLSGNGAKPKEK
jgi:multidrug resistance efflux pump